MSSSPTIAGDDVTVQVEMREHLHSNEKTNVNLKVAAL
jgi:hypothetical protein